MITWMMYLSQPMWFFEYPEDLEDLLEGITRSLEGSEGLTGGASN